MLIQPNYFDHGGASSTVPASEMTDLTAMLIRRAVLPLNPYFEHSVLANTATNGLPEAGR